MSQRDAPSGRFRCSGFREIRSVFFRLVPPIWLLWAGAAYASPPSVGPIRVAGYSLQLVHPWSPGTRTHHICPAAGQRLAGSDGPAELKSSSAVLLFTGYCGESREVIDSLPSPL